MGATKEKYPIQSNPALYSIVDMDKFPNLKSFRVFDNFCISDSRKKTSSWSLSYFCSFFWWEERNRTIFLTWQLASLQNAYPLLFQSCR